MSAARTGRAHLRAGTSNTETKERPLSWPGDPKNATPENIDFEALAHVLANTCLWGGRSRRFHSLAAHAVILSEEIEALDGLGNEDRRALALHALLIDAPAAWFGDTHAGGQPSARAIERTKREGEAVRRAVLEAAGLDPELPDEWSELLRFVKRMTGAAERRDLPDAAHHSGASVTFPPCKRRIRPLGPERAARLWLERFNALKRPPRDAAAAHSNPVKKTNEEETRDGAHKPAQNPAETETQRADRKD